MTFKIMAASLLAAFVFVTVNTSAEAKNRHHGYQMPSQSCSHGSLVPCMYVVALPSYQDSYAPVRPRKGGNRRIIAHADTGVTYLPHPPGCPTSRFCGCGARKDLGIDDVRLNLAANWPRYYRGSTPVAVWSHHVAIIEQFLGNGMAMLRDYNSGGRLSRRHVRDISRARIIGGSHMAAL